MNDPFLAALGICKRAGKLSFGFETVKCAMQIGQAQVVFSANDLSPKTAKELVFICENLEVEHIKTSYDMKTLGSAIGKMTGIVAVTDEGFKRSLKQKLLAQEDIK
jgi:ribosomal protein L7Ae-like RNA K-turn-binding protein